MNARHACQQSETPDVSSPLRRLPSRLSCRCRRLWPTMRRRRPRRRRRRRPQRKPLRRRLKTCPSPLRPPTSPACASACNPTPLSPRAPRRRKRTSCACFSRGRRRLPGRTTGAPLPSSPRKCRATARLTPTPPPRLSFTRLSTAPQTPRISQRGRSLPTATGSSRSVCTTSGAVRSTSASAGSPS